MYVCVCVCVCVRVSIHSDAPDDYVALRELKDKPDFRAKFNLTDEMVGVPTSHHILTPSTPHLNL